ncbi:MAG: cryptochrome/photolyase family protein [Sphingomonadales bacterium]|nr:cryptochrome/photolyase family protein [Sphingomonadales bacterium]
MRSLRIIFGNQISRNGTCLRDAEPGRDALLITSTARNLTRYCFHKKRIVFFNSSLRHLYEDLRAEEFDVDYYPLGLRRNVSDHEQAIEASIKKFEPERIIVCTPNQYDLVQLIKGWEGRFRLPVELREDGSFLCSDAEFGQWAEGRSQFLAEDFYRFMRRKTGLLMTADGKPEGGRWNFDRDNRKRAPPDLAFPDRMRFAPDRTTREIMDMIERSYAHHPGRAEGFDYAVTGAQAEAALDHFIEKQLPYFGDYQDAMLAGEGVLYHSVLSAYFNAGMLDPLTAARRAEAAYHAGDVPLNAAEGFIRQIIGWREYVRGIYHMRMPAYGEMNFFGAGADLPGFYWTGETHMACMRGAMEQLLEEAYTHHIQRLMVLGLFALLYGVKPKAFDDWHMDMYVDAMSWASVPNVIGMSLFADGGIVASKPYVASGRYINRMSDYCAGCRYDPKLATGSRACPFTTFYWDFLDRHHDKLKAFPRMAMQLKNLERKDAGELAAIRAHADALREKLEI